MTTSLRLISLWSYRARAFVSWLVRNERFEMLSNSSVTRRSSTWSSSFNLVHQVSYCTKLCFESSRLTIHELKHTIRFILIMWQSQSSLVTRTSSFSLLHFDGLCSICSLWDWFNDSKWVNSNEQLKKRRERVEICSAAAGDWSPINIMMMLTWLILQVSHVNCNMFNMLHVFMLICYTAHWSYELTDY